MVKAPDNITHRRVHISGMIKCSKGTEGELNDNPTDFREGTSMLELNIVSQL